MRIVAVARPATLIRVVKLTVRPYRRVRALRDDQSRSVSIYLSYCGAKRRRYHWPAPLAYSHGRVRPPPSVAAASEEKTTSLKWPRAATHRREAEL